MNSAAPSDAAALLGRLCHRAERSDSPRTAFVLAHPDDETVSATSLLRRVAAPLMIYVTDGAPRDGQDAAAAGYASYGDYARARKSELRNALNAAGLSPACLHFLDIPDQEASENLPAIALELAQLFRGEQPELVITHPYEGGHPDHDATAFAVHAACALLHREHRPAPTLVEMTSYHDQNGSFGFGTFLDNSDRPQFELPLHAEGAALKRQLIACHVTQQRVLRSVPVDTERFRIAPNYNFTKPPHPGPLLYERFSWKMDGARWRALAREALEELGLSASPGFLPHSHRRGSGGCEPLTS